MHSAVAVIPARFASSRFPGKPLAKILNKTMLQRTYEQACKASLLDAVWITTDDERIAAAAIGFGAPVVLTPASCRNGTERIACALELCPALQQYEYVVNVQGDEPIIDPDTIDAIVRGLKAHPDASVVTPVTSFTDEGEYLSRHISKVAVDRKGNVMLFTRAAIGNWEAAQAGVVKRHIGVYGFRKDFLATYLQISPAPMQLAEDLELMAAVENGHAVKVVPVAHVALGVDRPEDIQKVENYLCSQSISS